MSSGSRRFKPRQPWRNTFSPVVGMLRTGGRDPNRLEVMAALSLFRPNGLTARELALRINCSEDGAGAVLAEMEAEGLIHRAMVAGADEASSKWSIGPAPVPTSTGHTD